MVLSEDGGSGEEDNEENGEIEDLEKRGGIPEERRRREDVCVSSFLSIFAISKSADSDEREKSEELERIKKRNGFLFM